MHVWDMFSTDAVSLDYLADTVMSCINFCVELCILTKTLKPYSNNKPLFTKDIQLHMQRLGSIHYDQI